MVWTRKLEEKKFCENPASNESNATKRAEKAGHMTKILGQMQEPLKGKQAW